MVRLKIGPEPIRRGALVSLSVPRGVESDHRGGGQTGRWSLVGAGVLEPFSEYRTHGRRAGLREARTVTRARLERACTSKGSEDHVCLYGRLPFAKINLPCFDEQE